MWRVWAPQFGVLGDEKKAYDGAEIAGIAHSALRHGSSDFVF